MSPSSGEQTTATAHLCPACNAPADVDGDGRQELVVPSSFPLSSEADPSEYGITASAYDRLDDKFVLDENSTRTLRLKIADAYREAGESTQAKKEDRDHYTEVAQQLRKAACAP